MRWQYRIPLVAGLFLVGSAIAMYNYVAVSAQVSYWHYWVIQGLPFTMILASVVVEWIFGRDAEMDYHGFDVLRKREHDENE